MSYVIIDRRKNPKGKNLPNRQRFIDKVKHNIRDHLQNSGSKRSIKGDGDEEVQIDGVGEPHFGYDSASGEWQYVLPGNKDFVPGDLVGKPPNGGGSGNQAGTGSSEDDFTFHISKEEYLDIIFEDLELRDLVKRSDDAAVSWERRRAGITKQGSASNLDLVRSLRNSLGRRIALAFPLDRQIRELEEAIAACSDKEQLLQLEQELEALRIRRLSVSYIDPVDIRYKRYEQTPCPNNQAVMFCVMDVSASMGETHKEIAKRFFLLLYLFLEKKYSKVDIVFIKHTDQASEVTEQEFFYGTDSGGTIVSTGLDLLEKIIQQRYPVDSWNLYCVQASDGDNATSDYDIMMKIMYRLLPMFQFFVYHEIDPDAAARSLLFARTTVANVLKRIQDHYENLAVVESSDIAEVVPLFRQVFAKNEQ
jgi:uncharacterized protein